MMAMTHTLHLGDCRAVMATLADNSIDSIVCDPPYELGFMGKAWDNTGIAYDVTVWQQCYRVLKPGGHLVAFGGSRTYHRLAVAIEDAGFEIRDQIQWIYGSGFPKSHNLKDKYEGWGTALKPAHEPAVLARKPLCGTVADNVMTWGVGALNIDGTRIDSSDAQYTEGKGNDTPKRSDDIYGFASHERLYTRSAPDTAGRWPANVILDEDAATALDGQSGHSTSKQNLYDDMRVRGNYERLKQAPGNHKPENSYSDSGGASRFFYTAKASKAEREAGLYYDEWVKAGGMEGRQDGSLKGEPVQRANHHPTVKPLSLMRYLVRLVTPKHGKVLDPFMGSGSTGCAAVREGFAFVGIDITPEYVAIAQKRIDHYAVTSPLMNL
jgi:site-specific DNA-methyltransferase (adenine-specific)